MCGKAARPAQGHGTMRGDNLQQHTRANLSAARSAHVLDQQPHVAVGVVLDAPDVKVGVLGCHLLDVRLLDARAHCEQVLPRHLLAQRPLDVLAHLQPPTVLKQPGAAYQSDLDLCGWKLTSTCTRFVLHRQTVLTASELRCSAASISCHTHVYSRYLCGGSKPELRYVRRHYLRYGVLMAQLARDMRGTQSLCSRLRNNRPAARRAAAVGGRHAPWRRPHARGRAAPAPARPRPPG